MRTIFFDKFLLLWFAKICQKKLTKIWNVDVDNIAILKLIEMKNYFIGYLDIITPLVLILPKMNG